MVCVYIILLPLSAISRGKTLNSIVSAALAPTRFLLTIKPKTEFRCSQIFSPKPSVLSIKRLPHSLMSQLHAQKGSSIGRNSTSQRRSKAREERLVATLSVKFTNNTTQRDVALGSLQTRLDSIDGEDGDPHGDTGSSSGAGNCRQTQLASRLSGNSILGAQFALDVLVGGEVGGGSRTIAGKSGDAAAEDAAQTALAVQAAGDVETTAVLGLFAGGESLLTLDLEDDLDALKGGGDGGHGDGGEETGGGNLSNRQAVRADGGGGRDELLAEVVSPEGNGNWEELTNWVLWENCNCLYLGGEQKRHRLDQLASLTITNPSATLMANKRKSIKRMTVKLTHGRNTNQRRTHTRIQSPPQSIPGNTLPYDINGRRVDAALGSLQAHLDQVKRVANNNGTDTTKATRRQSTQLRQQARLGGVLFLLQVLLGLWEAGDLVGHGGGEVVELLVDSFGGGGRHGGGFGRCCVREERRMR